MGMDKYGCFMQMYVYYYWNHRQQSMKTRNVSKVIDFFQNNLFMSIRHEKTNIELGSYYFYFFALSNLLTPVYIFVQQGSSLLLNKQNVHLLFTITFVRLRAQILYVDATKFSIKLFSFIYIFCFCC